MATTASAGASAAHPLSHLARRAVTIPVFTTLAVVLVALAPAWISAAIVVDGVRDRHRWPTTRGLSFLTAFFVCEAIGIAVALLVVVGAPFVARARFLSWNFALQVWWTRSLFAAARRCFSLRVVVDGESALTPGPIYLLVRHASVADTLFPAVFASGRYGIRLRYVLKEELLWDPCLDLVGNRLPNAFVRRGTADTDIEVEKVRALANDLAADEGVLVFPEGTRFTAKKRAAIVEKLAHKDPEAAAHARALTHTLPPKRAGTLALLEAHDDVDVVVCAHRGLDRVSTLKDVFSGDVVGTEVYLRFWRVSSSTIPRDSHERARWLHEQWRLVDDVAAGRALPASTTTM